MESPKPAGEQRQRSRARSVGLEFGVYETGAHNAITDVPGVRVGHSTIVRGNGKHLPGQGPVRTGVTAVLPRTSSSVFEDSVIAGAFVLNGAGEVAGLTQVVGWGYIETPILLTNTLSVGAVSEATVQYMLEAHPEIGRGADVIIPVVGECDDSWLNDIAGRHVRKEHVYAAIESATAGVVEEGSVGGGTGMMTCGFKAGIGTSSRKLAEDDGAYTLGMLVMSNFGVMNDLRLDGLQIGRLLSPRFAGLGSRPPHGSIIAIAATDAPLQAHQLNRLAKRVALGFGRAGSYAPHCSGEIVVAFSTANPIPRQSDTIVHRIDSLNGTRMDPLYQAAVEATEEAIANALFAADEMIGIDDRKAPALPIDAVADIVKRYRDAETRGG